VISCCEQVAPRNKDDLTYPLYQPAVLNLESGMLQECVINILSLYRSLVLLYLL